VLRPRIVSLVRSVALVVLTIPLLACGHPCGLGLHDSEIVTPAGTGNDYVPCCGGYVWKDLALLPATEGEVNVTNPLQPPDNPADAFLVPTSCTRLFDGDYPGARPLCQIYVGPVTAKSASGRVKLSQGTYRLWMQAYTTNTRSYSYYILIDVFDYRCLPVVQ
jgi:hypothetical protein